MLETEKNIQIQKDIIEILNDQTTIISTKTLKELLGYSSPNTILAVCKDLQEILKNLYPDGSVLLTINHNGVELIRNFVSLEELYQKFNQSELLFEIFAAVFFNEEVLVADFCQIHGVSESTLARKIRLINDGIKDYDLRIIFSSRMRLKGNEVKRRLLFYTFLNAFSSQAADQLSGGEISRCIPLARKVARYIDLDLPEEKTIYLSFMLYIINQAIQRGDPVVFLHTEKMLLGHFAMPPLPDFLSVWSGDDWRFFLISLYCSELFDFSLCLKKPVEHIEELKRDWLSAFFQYFPLKCNEQPAFDLNAFFYKQTISNDFLRLNDPLFHFLSPFNKRNTLFGDPFYQERFLQFWETFSAQHPSWRTDHMQFLSFFLCNYFCPFSCYKPRVVLSLSSSFNHLAEGFLKSILENYFQNKFELRFAADLEKSDLFIYASSLNEESRSAGERALLVHFPINEKDLQLLDDAFTVICQKKYKIE